MQQLNKEVKLNISITLASLLPKNIDVFYTYKGSLTTPPCNEVVTWVIFPKPVPISFTQVLQLIFINILLLIYFLIKNNLFAAK